MREENSLVNAAIYIQLFISIKKLKGNLNEKPHERDAFETVEFVKCN